MIVGYARTSTENQDAGYEAQHRDLTAHGCERIFAEQVSSVAKRIKLEEALNFVREGDVLVVTRLDRLARSLPDLLKIVEILEGRKVALKILNMQMDTSSATGRMMLQMIGAVAEFERRILLERQLEGIAKAKRDGKYKGRVPTARRQGDEMQKLLDSGMSITEIAKKTGVHRSNVYRVLALRKAPDVGQDGSRAA
jgi:DNA invertase Pin-like site-specific DNA recombinase